MIETAACVDFHFASPDRLSFHHPRRDNAYGQAMQILVAVVTAAAALAGAGVGARASARSALAVATAGERTARAGRLQDLRLRAASAFSDATNGAEWLIADRVEDSTLTPFRESMEPEYALRIARVRQARDALAEMAALSRPLSETAYECALVLGQFDEAWREGRSCSFSYHGLTSENSIPPKDWYGEQLTSHVKEISALRIRLLGEAADGSSRGPDVARRDGGLLNQLRDEIALLDVEIP